MRHAVLSLNTGSSSIKFAMFSVLDDGVELRLKGTAEGEDAGLHAVLRDADGNIHAEASGADLSGSGQPTRWIIGRALEALKGEAPLVVAHRVVHGGSRFTTATRLNQDILAALKALSPMAPLHQMQNLQPVDLISREWPELAQFACFDTGFHADRSTTAKRFGLPRKLEEHGIIRYGFHGLSYAFIARELARLSPGKAAGRVIVAHLGSGASLCAMRNGRSVDTTMSFTPLDGLVMGTRSGDLDPGAVLYLIKEMNIGVEAVEELLYRQSGLLGVSGISADMRALLQSTEVEAEEAVALYCHSIVRHTGSMLTVLGGLDALVFTGGVGEHQPEVRRRICEALSWLGASLDPAADRVGNGRISAPGSRIEIWVIPTDEERIMAEQVAQLLERT